VSWTSGRGDILGAENHIMYFEIIDEIADIETIAV